MEDKYESDPDNYKTVGVAARVGDLMGLQHLVWNGRPVDVFDNRGWSPIHEAAHAGFPGCLEFLLRQSSVDPDWQTHMKETAMLLAAREGNVQCLRALLNVQADVDLSTDEGYTPLWEAISRCSLECIRLLIKKGADVNVRVYTGYSPLHLAAEHGHANIVNYLLQHGAQQDVRSEHGLTPIFLAANFGHIDCLKCLLRHAKEKGNLSLVNVPAMDNATPLLIAAQEGHAEIVDLLLQHEADADITVTENGSGPLQYAVFKGHAKCVSSLLPKTSLSGFEHSYNNMHPIVLALQWEDTHILRQLLKAGLDANKPRLLDHEQVVELSALADGPLPGTKASVLCHIPNNWPLDGARLLLEAGLSPNAKEDEVPPLLAAMWHDAFPLFCLLLKFGATPNFYHHNFRGNVAMLFALKTDLENRCNRTRTLNISTTNVHLTSNSNHAKSKEMCHWIEQLRQSYVWHLFSAGGEIESLFRMECEVGGSDGEGVSGLISLLKTCVREKAVVTAVLAQLLSLAICVSIPKCVIVLVADEDQTVITQFSDATFTLAHACRLKIIRTISRGGLCSQDSISSLKLPETLQDYLLFLDLEPYIRTLSKQLPLKNS